MNRDQEIPTMPQVGPQALGMMTMTIMDTKQESKLESSAPSRERNRLVRAVKTEKCFY